MPRLWRRSFHGALLSLLLSAGVVRAEPTRPPSLPLKRVRLYEVGVGYYERVGRVGALGAELPVPVGHLDDALKTLVILSSGAKATVSAVEFRSRVSREMARTLSGLAPSSDGPSGVEGMLATLRGARVEVRNQGELVSGRLVEVFPASTDTVPCGTHTEAHECIQRIPGSFTLLGDDGSVRQILRSEKVSVRALDREVSTRLQAALDALFEPGAGARESLVVHAQGNAPLGLGYVAQAPVWRSTYRLVFDAERGMLQGFALVHNDSDENWRGVQVELANGQPDSYLFPLAAPRYISRRVEAPDDESSTVPQLLGTTVDNLEDGYSLSGIGEGGGGRGEGIGLGSIGTIGHGSAGLGLSGKDSGSSLLDIGNLAATAQSQGVEAGAIFTYSLAAPVDLKPRSSALLPFLQTPVSVKQIAWVRVAGQPAESGAYLTNDSDQTLPPGTISVFSGGGFSGETHLTRLKPKESQVLRFGLDLDLVLEVQSERLRDETRLVSLSGATLTEHYVHRHDLVYALENRSGSARHVYLGLDVVTNSRISGDAVAGYDADEKRPWVAFEIAARSKTAPKVVIEEGLTRGRELDKESAASLAELGAAPSLPAGQRKILSQAATALRETEALRASMTEIGTQRSRLAADIQRYREDLKALGSRDEDESEKLVKRLTSAEDRDHALELKLDQTSAKLKSQMPRVLLILQGLKN